MKKVILLLINSKSCSYCHIFRQQVLPELKIYVNGKTNIEFIELMCDKFNSNDLPLNEHIKSRIKWFPGLIIISYDDYYNKGCLNPNCSVFLSKNDDNSIDIEFDRDTTMKLSYNDIILWIDKYVKLSPVESQNIINLLCIFKFPAKNLNNKKIMDYIPKCILFNILFPYVIPNLQILNVYVK